MYNLFTEPFGLSGFHFVPRFSHPVSAGPSNTSSPPFFCVASVCLSTVTTVSSHPKPPYPSRTVHDRRGRVHCGGRIWARRHGGGGGRRRRLRRFLFLSWLVAPEEVAKSLDEVGREAVRLALV
eukprot:scaffold13728_cov69-Phaeocystis_antarctica.AAC.5